MAIIGALRTIVTFTNIIYMIIRIVKFPLFIIYLLLIKGDDSKKVQLNM